MSRRSQRFGLCNCTFFCFCSNARISCVSCRTSKRKNDFPRVQNVGTIWSSYDPQGCRQCAVLHLFVECQNDSWCVCVCVKAKKCAPDLLPAFASCPRLKKMKTDSWPQYIICNSFVIQKSGQIIAAPATVGQIQAWSRAPAEVGWMLWDISSSNPTWTSPADFGNGILQVFGLTWRDSRRKGIISSPSISCFRTKATSGGGKKGLWLVVSYEICDCICNTEVALLENLTRTVPHAPNAIESH